MKLIKRTLFFLLIIIVLLIGYLFLNLLAFESRQINPEQADLITPSDSSLSRFSEALRLQTISPEDPTDFDSSAFVAFNEMLERNYPLADSILDKTYFEEYSILYFWEGSNPDLKPAVLMGHTDVVPVIDTNLEDWKFGAFNGTVAQDTIWGRGTLDDKINVIGLMEAVEALLTNGFQPARSVYLSFGHDEEVGGSGAQAVAAYMKAEGMEPGFVLDEGSVIASGLIPGISSDVALIGIAEKGFATLKLSVDIEGGHSSMPQKETAIDVLAGAIHRVKSNPFPTSISEPTKQFFEYLGPEMEFPNNLVFANSNLLAPVIKRIYEGSSAGNANVRTTTSPTVFNSGTKENVIPKRAEATINFRILPGETTQSVRDRVESVIDDQRVILEFGPFKSEPSAVSDPESEGFKLIQKTIGQVYPEVLVGPSLVVVATDSRHFAEISENIFRFSPIRLDQSNISSIHGINERVSVAEFNKAIQFYAELIRKL